MAKRSPQREVNRLRRTIYIYIVTALAAAAAFYLALSGLDTKTAQVATDGFISVVMWTVVAYIAGHSVDRSGVLEYLGKGRMEQRKRMRRDEDKDDTDCEEEPAKRPGWPPARWRRI